MKINHRIVLFFLLIISPLQGIFAQNKYSTITVTDSIPINLSNRYEISNVSIIPFSEKVVLRGAVLKRDVDYHFTYSNAVFALSDTLPYSVFDTLLVIYETIRLGLKKEYRKRSLVVRYDEKTGDTVQVVKTEGAGFTPEAIFGPGMQKSGTLIRGFTVGTTKDFTLNSGLRLQISGKITEDIEVVAALTDQNTPIQPEGNTETLEEIDKVFIQIIHQNAAGTFGDYTLNNRNGEFGVINRKLQGLMGTINFKPVIDGYIAVAGQRGKFNTNNFNGVDEVQGPYQLTGLNGEKDIVVLAGTEKVFLDGIEMIRGENNDYTIEYSNATITFTPRKLITNASRIAVDFEYTDRRYARNFFGSGAAGELFDGKFKLGVQYLQEGDDQDAPIDISLSEEDKQILEAAGDDRLKAVKSGVTIVEPDSLGIRRGIYQAVDTLINNEPFTYYVYNPGESLSIYNVSFSYVGDGKGDYARDALGEFRFVGIGQAGYLPIILLPVPQLKQLGNITASVNPIKNVIINLEYAGSLWDRNRFSGIDDGDNYGFATNILLNVIPTPISLGSLNLGKIGFSYKDRFINKNFTSTDRFNEVEFDRIYNTSGSPSQEDEQFREAKINLIPIEELNITSLAGFLRRGDSFNSNRFNNSLRFSEQQTYNLYYNLDFVDTKNSTRLSKWVRQAADGHYIFWKLKPGVNFLTENKEDRNEGIDSLLAGSLKYFELNPYLQLIDLEGFGATAKYSYRDDYLPLNGIMEKESESRAQIYDMTYRGIEEVSTSLNLTIRNRYFTEAYRQLGYLDTEQLLIRSQSKFNFWEPIIDGDLFYEVNTEKQAKLEKVFVRVEQGTGNYRYLGDLNGNGIADENEFEPTLFDGDFILVTIPTDELYPVINLKTNTRWKIKYGEIFKPNTFWKNIFEPLSTETSWRIEEITREEELSKIYLLQLNYFQVPGVTIRGANFFLQDIFINENRQDLSFRFRYSQKFALSDFNSGIENGYNRERSLRIRFRLVKEISFQTDIINLTDNVEAPQPSARNRRIVDNNITTDFSYRPINDLEAGLKFKFGRSEDSFPEQPTVIDLNSQLLRINLSFAQTGRLRIEAERIELLANTSENFIPYEMLNGNQPGKNYYWRLNFDYRVASFLQTTVSYDGRWQGEGRVIHTARAEARAYF